VIDVVQPALDPIVTHHGAEVVPLVQLIAAGGFGLSMIVGAIAGIAARLRRVPGSRRPTP
jgi:hypothetical protein